MSGALQRRVLWGDLSPFAGLSGGALLIVASDRLAHSLTALAALAWVYCLSALAAFGGSRLFPERGKAVAFAFAAFLAAALFLLPLWMLFPLAAIQALFAVSLVPMLCSGSGLCRRLEGLALAPALRLSLAEALSAGSLAVILSLIREPLGFRSLSLPGGAMGIAVFHPFGEESPLFLRLLSGSFGALLLLGYLMWMHRQARSRYSGEGDG